MLCPRVISRFYWILLQLSYLSEDFPDTDFVLQVSDIDLSWRYEDIVVWQTYETLSDGFLDVYVIHRHAVKRAHSPSLDSDWSAGPMLPPHWLLRSPLEICGITELVCLARRSPGTIMGISLAGSLGNGAESEDLWSWYKLSSGAWSNYQWSCAWPPVDIFKKQFLHCYFLFQVSSYILFYCPLLGALFYWIKERESFLQSAAICSAVIMQWCGICSFAKMFSSSFHFAWCQYHAASALQWQNDNAI